MKPQTTTILTELMDGRLSSGQIRSGLHLQFKAGDVDNPDNRLCAFRRGESVNTGDLTDLRRALETVLPPNTAVALDDEQAITSRDKQTRHYRVFRWPATPAAMQMELLHVETAGRRPYED